MTEPLAIHAENLGHRYRRNWAVRGLNLQAPQGRVYGFLGPNGAGKSTTMRILTGYLPASSGSVSICGVPVASQPDEAKRHIGYMPENNPLP